MQAGIEPYIREEAREYWEALSREELRIQRCIKCGEHVFYPREACPYDQGELKYVRVSGRGKVLSFTVVHKDPNPVFAPYLPMVVAVIQLEEGPTMMSRVINVEPDQVQFNQEVAVVFERISEQRTLPFFQPVDLRLNG